MATRQEKEQSERKEGEYGQEEEEGRRAEMEQSHERDYYEHEHGQEQERAGVIGSILKSVADTLESAKEAVIGKPYTDDEPIREGRYYEEREREERGINRDKGADHEKAGEAVKEKLEETTESAKEKARRAKETLAGGGRRKDEGEEEPKEKYMDTEDEARRKMQERKLREEGYNDEDRKRAEAERETAEDRGSAGTRNIFSAIGSVTEAIKEMLTMPSDIVEETQAAREHGSTKRATQEKKVVDAQGNPVEASGRVPLRRADHRE